MRRKSWLSAAVISAATLMATGLVYAGFQRASGYICPLTGERLPCPKCCPLNNAASEGYTCPITGETLPCEKCCPLNQSE